MYGVRCFQSQRGSQARGFDQQWTREPDALKAQRRIEKLKIRIDKFPISFGKGFHKAFVQREFACDRSQGAAVEMKE